MAVKAAVVVTARPLYACSLIPMRVTVDSHQDTGMGRQSSKLTLKAEVAALVWRWQ